MQLIMLDRIDELRLSVPRIVDRYDDGDPRFAEDVKRWIRDAEEILTAARLPAAASLAALRGTLIAAEEGTVPAGVTCSGRATPRKMPLPNSPKQNALSARCSPLRCKRD